MKIFVISDIHGSAKYFNDFLEIFNEERGDLLVILGDLLYHGPRNPLPLGYDPKKVIELINANKEKIIWIKGNCDGEVDEMVLDISCSERGILFYNNHKIYLAHGHKDEETKLKLNPGDILLYGHLHVNFIKEMNNAIIANPGSISLPKNNSENSYLLIENNEINIYNLKRQLIIKKTI